MRRIPTAEALRICTLGVPRPDLFIHENGAFEIGVERGREPAHDVPPCDIKARADEIDDDGWIVIETNDAAWLQKHAR